MGPKKKGKKGKKKEAEEETPPEEPSEYDTMDIPMLKEVIHMLRQQLDKAQLDRNYVQHERDMIESFYEITKSEIEDLDNQVMAKDRDMEIMEDNHRVEVRVYVQKVKHLEYEHKNNLKRVQADGTGHSEEENDLHQHRENVLRSTKQSLKLELKERELSNEEEIDQMKQAHEKNLSKLREQFEKNNASLEERCQLRLQELQENLELRRKVDLHEIQERKNLHINDLMKNHEKAFTQIKNYYNDITKDNLKLIDSLKNEIAAMKKKATANAKLMHDVSLENKRLSEPLAAALQEVEHLRHELKDEQKDKLSLRHAKARLVYVAQQLKQLKTQEEELRQKCKAVEQERNLLYDTFEQTVTTIQRKGECKNLILEQRLASMEEQQQRKQAQLQEILTAANIEPNKANHVSQTVEELLQSKNGRIEQLKYELAKANKTYNDSLQVFQEKMSQCGIPEEEIRAMGFSELPTNTTLGPAGLVAVE